MIGLVEGIIYAYKAGFNMELYLNTISIGAAGSKLLDLYGNSEEGFRGRVLCEPFWKGFGIFLKERQNMGLGLPGVHWLNDFICR